MQGDWGPQPYPLTVGHEIVGTVAEVGADVTKFAVGDRVGVGCLVNSCGECSSCAAGEEQYCLNGAIGTYAANDVDGTVTQGGYSTSVVVTEGFVLRVPEAIPYDKSAAVRGHHHLLTAAALERGPGQEGRRHRPRRARSHGRQDRTRHGC